VDDVVAMAWAFWIGVIVGISLLFWWLWKFADRIEREEAEEQQWIAWLQQLWQYSPYEAQYWQSVFEEKFMR